MSASVADQPGIKMSEEDKTPLSPEDAKLEREIRSHRKFSLAEAIGRMAGSGLLKGTSPVTQKRQAELEIEHFLEQHLADAEGALEVILLRRVKNSEALLKSNYEQPLAALHFFVERTLGSEDRLMEFVREIDMEWGRMYLERPHFQREGSPPDREDPYSFASVRAKLSCLSEKLHGN